MTYIIVNGRLTDAAAAVISVQDRGFRFGDGVFETIAVHAGVPYQFEWHLNRLFGGLKSLKIPFDTLILQSFCQQLLQKNSLKDCILRIQVTRGIGSKGYLPDPNHPQSGPTFIIETAPLPSISTEKLALWQSSYRKISARALPVQYKLTQGINSTLARIEAQEQGCCEALLLNDQDHIGETSSGNIFWLKSGTLYTPSIHCDILPGSTRTAILRLSPYPVVEIEADMQAILSAEAVMITNSVWPVLPIGRMLPQDIYWDSYGIAEEFRALLAQDRASYARARHNEWHS